MKPGSRLLSFAALVLSGCGASGAAPATTPPSDPDPEVAVEVDTPREVAVAYVAIAPPAVRQAYGSMHRCEIEDGGRVQCVGDHQHGQLGFGALRRPPGDTPPVVLIDDAESLCARELSTCAVRRSGEVWCWGWNINGQLGDHYKEDGSPSYRSPTPLRAYDVTDATACAMGEDHACALSSDGTVRCWGVGTLGQLGEGPPVAPVRRHISTVVGLDDAVHIAAGRAHACALRRDGRVLCWGVNSESQVGPAEERAVLVPTLVPDLERVAVLALGGDVSCALDVDGVAFCWGKNAHGELGRGAVGAASGVPRTPEGLGPVAEISVGTEHVCARTSDARVFCWGSGQMGQLETRTRRNSATPIEVENLRGAVRVVAKPHGTCGIMEDGVLRCTRGPRRDEPMLL